MINGASPIERDAKMMCTEIVHPNCIRLAVSGESKAIHPRSTVGRSVAGTMG